jgi:hypothetical protein
MRRIIPATLNFSSTDFTFSTFKFTFLSSGNGNGKASNLKGGLMQTKAEATASADDEATGLAVRQPRRIPASRTPFKAPYRSTWTAGFGSPRRLLKDAVPPEAAAATIAAAALARDPRDRYRPGLRNRLNARLLTTLPARVTDGMKTRIAGVQRAGSSATKAESDNLTTTTSR